MDNAPGKRQQFELEALEQRLMLSGDAWLAGAMVLDVASQFDSILLVRPGEERFSSELDGGLFPEGFGLSQGRGELRSTGDIKEHAGGIFDGAEVLDIELPTDALQAPEGSESPVEGQSAGNAEDHPNEAMSVVGSLSNPISAEAAPISDSSGVTEIAVGGGDDSATPLLGDVPAVGSGKGWALTSAIVVTGQLTETLRGANAPPVLDEQMPLVGIAPAQSGPPDGFEAFDGSQVFPSDEQGHEGRVLAEQTSEESAMALGEAAVGLVGVGPLQELSASLHTANGPPLEQGRSDGARGAETTIPEVSVFDRVVFIDASVQDAEILVGGVLPGAMVFMLDGGSDGVEQIEEVLAGFRDLAAVAIVTHGVPGGLKLGSTWLHSGNLGGYTVALKEWGRALAPGGDLLLYACRVAGGTAGWAFVQGVNSLTQVDVAATAHLIGGDGTASDWRLYTQEGLVADLLLFSSATLRAYNQQLDGGPITSFGSFQLPAQSLTGLTAIAAGEEYSLGLRSDGTVVAWGHNDFGEATPPEDLRGVVAIASGTHHGLALKSDGTVVGWGFNDYGQASPPPGLSEVVAVAAQGNYSLALLTNGTVVGWGDNSQGQAVPPVDLIGVVAIAAGGGHSLALKSDGTVVAWGRNDRNQAYPPAGLAGVVAIAAGGVHSLALKSDGTVVAWGSDYYGQATPPPDLNGVAAIAAYGYGHSLALKSDGTVVAWGLNEDGQATPPTGLSGVVAVAAGSNHSLALKSDGSVVGWGSNSYGAAMPPAGLSDVIAVAAGINHGLALKTNGTVVGWGSRWSDNFGQATPPAGLSGVLAIAAGGYHSLALKSDGSVVGWGHDGFGQATPPADLSGVVAIAAGRTHSLALKSDGTVVAWGLNEDGQATPPSELSGVVAIAAGSFHSLALKSDGTVVGWGWDLDGQAAPPAELGGVIAIAAGLFHSLALKNDGTVVGWGSSPDGEATPPPDLNGVIAIAAGIQHSLALKNDGTVVGWGRNHEGQSTPPSDLSGVIAISAGGFHSLALRTVVLEDGDEHTIQFRVLAGIGEVNEFVTVHASSSDPSLIPDPVLEYFNPSSTALLMLRPAVDAFGTVIITVTVKNHGPAGGPVSEMSRWFEVTVLPANDSPVFVKGPDQVVGQGSGLSTVEGWATGISPGPPNEAGQTLGFFVEADRPELFEVQPAVAPDGTLTFVPDLDKSGSTLVTVRLNDSGGTEHGGEDTSEPQTFWITITSVNRPPTLDPIDDRVITEDTDWIRVPLSGIGAGEGEFGQTVVLEGISSDSTIIEQIGFDPIAPDGTSNLLFKPLPDADGVVRITVTVRDDGGSGDGGIDTFSLEFEVTVDAVNDAPGFVKGADVIVLEDSGLRTVAGWATGISAGPAEEAGQVLEFEVISDNPGLFQMQPAVTSDGTLSYRLAPDANGTAVVTVRLRDNGGTEHAGVDTSLEQAFTITVLPVNDAPGFVKGADVIVLEDSGLRTVAGWATGISAGPAEEAGQVLEFEVISDNPGLFQMQPAVTSDGTLSYRLAPDANGTAVVTVRLRDNGGTEHAGVDTSLEQAFTITVLPVNDAPSFVKGHDESVLEDSGLWSVPGWATSISAGPAEEAGQVLEFEVISDNPGLFQMQPAVTSDGTLSYRLASDANGTAVVTARLRDNGGTEQGGVDTSQARTFTITVEAVNDAPKLDPLDPVVLPADVAEWIVHLTGISAGPANEGGQILRVTATSNNAELLPDPTLEYSSPDATGTLRLTPASGRSGRSTITVAVQDDGGQAHGGEDTRTRTFTVEVSPTGLVVVWNAPADIVYGTPLGPGQLNATANVPGQLVYTPGAGTVLGAGLGQPLSATFTATDQVAYPGSTTMEVTINVLKAPLTVTADDKMMAVGTPLPALSWSIDGFVHGDTAASSGLVVTAETDATPGSPEGHYPIWVRGPEETANYQVLYLPGTLTVVFAVVPELRLMLTDCVQLNVGTVTMLASPQPGGPVARGSQVELVFTGLPGMPKFKFDTVDLYQDRGSEVINGFVLPIAPHNPSGTIGVGTGIGRDFLQFEGATMEAGVLSLRDGVADGELKLTAQTATLFPTSTRFGGTITNGGQSGPGLVARFVPAEDRWVYEAQELTLTVSGVLEVKGQEVQLSYPACEAAGQSLATVPDLTVTLLALNNLTLTGSELTLRPEGFSLKAAHTQSVDFRLGGFLAVTQGTVTMSDLNYVAGSAPTGTLGFAATRAVLFPGSGFAGELTAVSGGFDLAQKRFVVAVDELAMTVAQVMTLSAAGVTLSYALEGTEDQELARVPVATLQPFGPDQSPVTVQDLQLRKNGFRLGNLERTVGQVTVGGFLELTTVVLRLENIDYTIGRSAQGLIHVRTNGGVFFPGQSFAVRVSDSPGDADQVAVAGQLDLGTRTLSLGLDQLEFSVEGVLKARPTGSPAIQLSYALDGATDQELLRIANLEIDLEVLGDATVTASQLVIRKNGFAVGDAEASRSQLTIPGFLEMTAPVVRLRGIDYQVNGPARGTILVTATEAVLFPGSNLAMVISDGADSDPHALIGQLDLATEMVSLDLDPSVLTVPGVLRVATPRVQLAYQVNGPDDQELVRVNDLTVIFLALDQAPITVQELVIRKNGFAVANAETNLGDVMIGGFLTLNAPRVSLSGLNYTVDGVVTGVLSITTNAAALFPGQASTPVLLRDGPDDDEAVVTGSYDFGTKSFALMVDTMEITAQDTIFIRASETTLRYDLDGGDSQVIVSVAEVEAVVAQWQIEGTVRGLEITKDAQFSVLSLTLDSHGLLQTLGLGGLLPFEITGLSVTFLGDTNQNGRRDPGEVFSLDAFDLRVRGYFNFGKMSGLPFTPIIRIGPEGSQRVFDQPQDTFDFTVRVVEGKVRPYELGPIAIGVLDLRVGEVVRMSGVIVLGGYKKGQWVSEYGGGLLLETSEALGGVIGGKDIVVAGQYDGETGELDLVAGFPVSFTLRNRIVVTDARLVLELGLGVGADSSVALRYLRLASASVERLEINLGGLLKLTATEVRLNMRPEPGENMAVFGSLSATVELPNLRLSGTAYQFAVGSDGGFKAFPGFGVSFAYDASTSAGLKWPSWLKIQLTGLRLSWPDFGLDPDKFKVVFDAVAEGLEAVKSLQVSGSITGAELDLDLLKRGKFPLVALESASVSVKGPLFGGEAEGSLSLGLLRVDAAGNRILPGDLTTPVADRVFYGGITAAFAFSGASGFEIRIGLSERGPLSVYVMADYPVLLHPPTGLTLNHFRAGVTFYDVLPSITDPLELRGAAFRPQSEMTPQQWWEQLQISVINQSRAPPGGGYWDAFNHPMKIEGGATLYSAYLTEEAFKADTDIILSTDGKLLINSRMTIGNTLEQRAILYADLSELREGRGAILYLSDTPTTHPVVTIRGALNFEFIRNDGTPVTEQNQADSFHLHIEGGIDVQASNQAKVTVEGAIDLTFGSGRVDIAFTGQLSLTALGREVTLLNAAGTLHLDTSGSSVKLWGALALTAELGFLEDVGIKARGLEVFTLNLSGEERIEVLDIPGRGETEVILRGWSVGFLVQGTLEFKQGASDWFLMEGTFAMELGADSGLSVLAEGQLHLRASDVPLLSFGFTGFLQVNSRGVAALLDLSLTADLPVDFGVSLQLDGQATLMLNTTNRAVTYVLPASAGTVPGGGTNRTITVPGGPPGRANQSYLSINSQASLQLLSLRVQGSIYLLVAPSLIQVQVAGRLDLEVGGTTFFSFDVAGGLQINEKGVAAAVGLSVRTGLPDSLGVTLSTSYRLEVNTTNQVVVLPSITLDKGPYARIRADGRLYAAGLRLEGYFEITAGPQMLSLVAHASLELRAGSVSIFTFQVEGGFQIDQAGFAGAVMVSSTLNLSVGFKFDSQFRLEINTTGQERVVGGITLEAGRYGRISAAGSLLVSGLEIRGNFVFTVGESYVQIEVAGSLELRVGTVQLLDFEVKGGMLIDRQGIAAVIDLSPTTGLPDSVGFSLAIQRARLELNTTSREVTLAGITLPAQMAGVRIEAAIQILQGFRLEGTLLFRVQPDRLVIGAKLSMDLYLTRVNITGELALFADGLAGRIVLQLPEVKSDFFTLKGSFVMEVNTTGRTVFDIAPRSAMVCVQNVRLSLVGLTFSGSLCIRYVDGLLEIDVPASNPLTASIFNAFTVQVHGHIRSNGEFSLTGTANVNLGRKDLVAVVGNASVTISNTGAAGTITGRLYILNQSIVDVPLAFNINTSGFSVSVGAAVDFNVLGVLRVKGNATLSISNRGLELIVANVGARIFNSIDLNIAASLSTITSRYSFTGRASFSVGSGDIGARADLSVFISNYDGVRITASGSVWAGVSVWGRWIGAKAGFKANVGLDGRFNASVRACLSIPYPCIKKWKLRTCHKNICASATVHVDLKGGLRVWLSDLENVSVFLDVNRNRTLDPGEPETFADADGYFSFLDEDGAEQVRFHRYDPLGSLAPYDTDHDNQLGPEEGQLYVVGGIRLDPNTGNLVPGDGPVELDPLIGSLVTGFVPAQDATRIFFDANFNRMLDQGEVAVVPEPNGFYSFVDLEAIRISNLGRLAPFDTNGNGVIDPEEGVFVLGGGNDKNTGLPNAQQIVVSAEHYGVGTVPSSSPLSNVLFALEQMGTEHDMAIEAIQAAFGVPPYIDLVTIDPRADASEGDWMWALAVAEEINTLTAVGSRAFSDPAIARAVIVEELARQIRTIRFPETFPLDEDGYPVYEVPFDLGNPEKVQAVLTAAARTIDEPLTEFQVSSISRIIVELNWRVFQTMALAYGSRAQSADLITALADLKKVSQVEAAAVVALIRGGTTDPMLLADDFVRHLPDYLNGTTLPPYVSRVDDQTSTGGAVSVGFVVENPNQVPAPLRVSAGADNPGLLPEGAVELVQGPDGWTLTLTPVVGLSGEALVTIQATVTFGDGTSLISTEQFVLKVAAVNQSPTVSPIEDRTISEDGSTGALVFEVGDFETGSDHLEVSVSSSNTALVAPAGLTLSGSGAFRTLRVTPTQGRSGVTAITLRVSDGVSETVSTFLLTVLPRNDAPSLVLVPRPAFLDPDSPLGAVRILVPQNSRFEVLTLNLADRESFADTLTLAFSSSDPNLLSEGSFVLSGVGAQRHLTLVPAAWRTGWATVTVTLSDGVLTATRDFEVLVALVNTAPTISPLEDQTLREGSPLTVGVAVEDDHAAAGDLMLSAVSSDPDLLPGTNLIWGGSGGNRTLTLSPVAGRFGLATITVTAWDGASSATENFTVAVLPVNRAPGISAIADQQIFQNGTSGILPFTVSDRESDASLLTVEVSSTNQRLLPQGAVSILGWGAERLLVISPPVGEAGTALVTLTVSDGELSASTTFGVEVLPLELRILDWSSVQVHQGLGAVGLSISDDGRFSEPRVGGVRELWLRFSTAVAPSSFTPEAVWLLGVSGPDNQPVDLSEISWSTEMKDDNRVGVIRFSQALPDGVRYRIGVDGAGTVEGVSMTGSSERVFTTLVGDVNGDLRVNNTDVGAVQSLRGTAEIDPSVAWQVRSDPNQDGRINNSDVGGLYPLRGQDTRFLAEPASRLDVAHESGLSAVMPLDPSMAVGLVDQVDSFVQVPASQHTRTATEAAARLAFRFSWMEWRNSVADASSSTMRWWKATPPAYGVGWLSMEAESMPRASLLSTSRGQLTVRGGENMGQTIEPSFLSQEGFLYESR